MVTILEMIVNIDCLGCEKKVKKALQNLDGVDNVDIDMDLQKVTVTGEAEQEKILKTVRKTGKKADLWPFPSSNNPDEYTSTEYFSNQYNYHSHPSSYFSSDHSSTSTDHHHLHEHHSHQNGNNYNNGPKYEYEYDRGNYNHPSPSILGGESTTMFSDENVNACSIM